jgi:hypothetical protein
MSTQTHSYEFTLVLSGFSELKPDVMDSLFEAGCDDGLLCLDEYGAPFIEFDREASSLEEAVRSAIADVHKTPYRVLRVESEAAATVQTINAELAAAAGEAT